MLVGLTGFAGVGKDTAAQTLIDAGFERRAFADPLRTGLLALNPWICVQKHELIACYNKAPNTDATGAFDVQGWRRDVVLTVGGNRNQWIRLAALIERFGWNITKREVHEVREGLQKYGTEAGRDVHGQLCWIKATENTMEVRKHYVITDVRFPNERDYIQQQGGLVIRICRDGVGEANGHSSEQVLDNVDVGVFNNGPIEALHDEIRRIVNEWYPTSFYVNDFEAERRLAEAQRPIQFGGVQLSELPRFEEQMRNE